METKYEQVEVIVDSMIDDLKMVTKVLCTDEDFDKCEDEAYEVPRYITADKHGFHLEYAMLSIEHGGTIKCKALGEDFGEELSLTVNELSWGEIIELHNQVFAV